MLGYSYIDTEDPISIPPPKVNGGLYVGEPAQQGAGWANIPVHPDPVTYSKQTMVPHQIPSYTRPGNNTVDSPYHEAKNNLVCRKS